MKKVFYLLALVAITFTACQKQPVVPNLTPAITPPTLTITLAQADYATLPSTAYPSKTFTIDNDADAKTYIPQILNSEYSNLVNGSTAAVTYAKSSVYYKPAADSVYADVAHTLVPADYKLLPGDKYPDFSSTQIISWIPYYLTSINKTAVSNELLVLTYNYYQEDVTPSAGVPRTDSFMYLDGKWVVIYTVSSAQYTSIGAGTYNRIDVTVSNQAIAGYFNTFLKTDPTVADTIKTGDVEYVSFTYYNYPTTYQRVLPLTYNGSNFVTTATTGTVNFIKQNGSWTFVQPLPVIAYTLTAADITLIGNGAAGTTAAKANLTQYLDFDSSWAVADLDAAMIEVLTADAQFKTPQLKTIYSITYPKYSGSAPNPLNFEYDGTKWIANQ